MRGRPLIVQYYLRDIIDQMSPGFESKLGNFGFGGIDGDNELIGG